MQEKEFNLLDEPWIRVIQPDCSVKEVSLTDALVNAHTYCDLRGELVTQDIAVLRLLLAVLHTVFERVDADGNPSPPLPKLSWKDIKNRWKTLWDLGHFPAEPIQTYLNGQHEKFWLFHPERPFWQVPEMKQGTKPTEYGAKKLNGELLESGDQKRSKPRLFSMFSGKAKNELTYPQAARWLLYINAFDDSSSKPTPGKSLPSPGTGWLGQLGLISAVGKNLFETLMLNLTLLQEPLKRWPEKNCPCWEMPKVRCEERKKINIPNNAAQLLTLQSRRLTLHRANGKVTGYSLLGGDFFPKEEAFAEQMTVWVPVSEEKQHRGEKVRPQRHDAAKQFWQEFPAAFANQEGGRKPGIVKWIGWLRGENVLDKCDLIRFRIASVQYVSPTNSSVQDTFTDTLSLHVDLLTELGEVWRGKIAEEVQKNEKLAAYAGSLAHDLTQAAGGSDDLLKDERMQAASQLYYRFDQPFRAWISSIEPGMDKDTGCQLWEQQARDITLAYGRELVSAAGPAAFIGRTITKKDKNRKKKTTRYTAPEAYNCFCGRVCDLCQCNQDNSVRRNHMQVPEKSMVYSIVSRKLQSIQNLPDNLAKAALANLRRGAGKLPGDLPELWGALLADLSEAELNRLCGKTGTPTKAEWAVYTALTTYAVHQQGHDCKTACMNTEEPFGQAVGRLVTPGDEDSLERIRNRFNRIATAQSMDEAANHLRSLVQLLREKNIGFNYPGLAADLYDFQFPELAPTVRLRWGQAFYRHITKNQEQKKNIGKDETHEKA